jgi:hypothetical protein
VNVPEKLLYGVNIHTDKEARKSLSYATGAKLADFSPKDGKVLMVRTFKKLPPNGSVNSMWGLVYQLHDQDALQAVIKEIKNGNLITKIGFWLDNAEVVYSSTAPKDISAVEDFEHCIKQNNIVERGQ